MTPEDRAAFITDIATALRTRITDKQLTDQESEWVRLAIQKEVQTIAFRRAVIEKTLSALLWSALVFVGLLIADGLKSHGVWR